MDQPSTPYADSTTPTVEKPLCFLLVDLKLVMLLGWGEWAWGEEALVSWGRGWFVRAG